MRAAPTLFEGERRTLDEAIELTQQSLAAYGAAHDRWCVAYSGGKDSTATLTLLVHLIETGRLRPPARLDVYYADTRLELPPLAHAAGQLLEGLKRRSNIVPVRARTVMAPLDKRFMVYVLGRGVPPPNNNTLRWCTRQIKVDPMAAAIEADLVGADGKVLMITGVREGESAARDDRIRMSCGKDGAECGQGWYQQALPEAKGIRGRIDTLAPLLHWRVCHVWDWLTWRAPTDDCGGWPTRMVADAYGGDEAEEINARTGCTACPLAAKDLALDTLISRMKGWDHLAPLKELKPLWRELRRPEHRKRKAEPERLKNGSLSASGQRMGPIRLESRLWALGVVLDIQARVNAAAERCGRPAIDILNPEEEARIRDLIAMGTWPAKWSGEDVDADVPLPVIYRDGSMQPLLGGF